MRYLTKKIYLILLFLLILFSNTKIFAKDTNLKYSRENISNYFLGIVSLNENNTTSSFKYLEKVQTLKSIHSNYNANFIRTLILLEKFDQAFAFAKSLENENKLFFEANLLLGLESFMSKDYLNAEKYFKRLNEFSEYNLFFEDFLENALITWVKASEKDKTDSFKFFNKIPIRYDNLKQIQNSFLQCYFDTPEVASSFINLTVNEKYSFSRYNFFLLNYFISKKNEAAAKLFISNDENAYNSNLLINQTKYFILSGKSKEITKLFDCKNPNDVIAEIFYVIANLYSTEKKYQLSNFYLKISLLLNSKFTPNKTLLAENFYNQKRYNLSKKTYNSLKKIGFIYSWHASINSATILLNTQGKEKAILNLKKNFNSISNPSFRHYYDMANFFKDNKYYKDSIKYYSLALENIEPTNTLVAKILDRRGTSYERLGNWKKAEKDLLESLKISPDQPHVLNYLAYSWIEKEINIDESLEMLRRASKLRENDGYIIDSLGWAYYKNKNYTEAKKFLQKAVELMPLDPIVNDHYGDALWMLDNSIQARYFWKHALSLDDAEEKLKDNINKKLIFGIVKNL